MTEPSALVGLLARVEGATGPDREIDARLWCFDKGYEFKRLSTDDDYQPPYVDCDPGPQWKDRGMPKVGTGLLLFFDPSPGKQPGGKLDWPHHNRMSGWTPYTASLDAALALVGRVLPGHAAAVGTMAFDPPGTPWGCIWAPTGSVLAQAEAPTPELALIKALLRALLADAERSEGGA